MTCFSRWVVLIFVLTSFCCNLCNAGFFGNLKGFFLDRLGRSRSDDNNSIDAESFMNIINLTNSNDQLRDQVSTLKRLSSSQKKQFNDLRKEKEGLNRAFVTRREEDRESIESELRSTIEEEFEGEKSVMIDSFINEKNALIEEHEEVKEKLSNQLAKKILELEAAESQNLGLTKVLEGERKRLSEKLSEASEDIRDLKKELKDSKIDFEILQDENSAIKLSSAKDAAALLELRMKEVTLKKNEKSTGKIEKSIKYTASCSPLTPDDMKKSKPVLDNKRVGQSDRLKETAALLGSKIKEEKINETVKEASKEAEEPTIAKESKEEISSIKTLAANELKKKRPILDKNPVGTSDRPNRPTRSSKSSSKKSSPNTSNRPPMSNSNSYSNPPNSVPKQ